VIDKKGVIRWTYIGEFAKDKWQALKKAISSYC
jgi:hypothetical protein